MVQRFRSFLFFFTIAALTFAALPPRVRADRRDEIAAQLQSIDKKIADAEAMQGAINKSPDDYADVPQTLAVLADTIAKLEASRDALIQERDALPAAPRAKPKPQKNAAPGPLDSVLPAIKKSPTLRRIFADLKKKRYQFMFGSPGKGTFCDRLAKTVVVDPNDSSDPVVLSGLLAHEFGHTQFKSALRPPSEYKDKSKYVDLRTRDSLADEGEATLVAIRAERELRREKTDLTVPGVKTKDYEAIYDKYPKAADRAKARAAIGAIFGKSEHPSTSTGQTYGEYYSQGAADAWDLAHQSSGTTPSGGRP